MKPSVAFAVLNLRLGGQMSTLVAAMDGLRERGVDAWFALPDGLPSPSKSALEPWSALPFVVRARRSLGLLRTLASRLGPSTLLHLMLPSPAWASLAAALPLDPRRLILQYEAPALAWDEPTRSALWDDPGLVAPRLVLNHVGWSRLGRRSGASHLATHPGIAAQLRELGFSPVYEVANLSGFSDEDTAPNLALPERLVGYVGHAHRVKGVDDLVEAFIAAAPIRPDLHLLLALTGDRSQRRLVRRLASAGLIRRALVVGRVAVERVLHRLDALVLPYRSMLSTTLYPSLLLEADRAGCPLIISRVAELAPILRDGVAGLITVPPRDVRALTDALVSLPPRDPQVRLPPRLRLPSEAERLDALVALYRTVGGEG